MRLIVFSDLDGTLLDHRDYGFAPARPALQALRAAGGRLILATSKTEAEIEPIRSAVGFADCPAIVENGAGLAPPEGVARPHREATDHARIRAALDHLPHDLRERFAGFSDWSAAEIAARTGLSIAAARAARDRRFSEPGVWLGTEANRERFLEALAAEGISAQMGGRFLTLSLGRTKADMMREALKAEPGGRVTVALGDAPNDAEMLEEADIAVIVANPAHPPLPTLRREPDPNVIRTEAPGPAGWNAAMLDILAGYAAGPPDGGVA
jgi:mannosyl-3-phosphoglycerate phosphatase